jgi:Y-X(10)_GDL-associated radical SAM protein
MNERLPHRYETDRDYRWSHPVHVVWELTLACNLKCSHCGSRAGKRRPNELTTAECLDVVAQLAAMGAREVSLIGGEAYLRPDWLDIVRAISERGMHPSMQTGGRALTEERVRGAAEAGLRSCGVSIDGLADLHDRLRGVKGAYDQALAALKHLRKYGIPSSVNTQITALTMPDLRPLLHVISGAGARNWQIQLTVAMGNAADHPELILQPYRLFELMPLLAGLYDEASELGVLIQPGNNIGYFGPYEHLWRVAEEARHWQGCAAGHTGLGIEADGTIKGCPSLPTVGYAGGNVRDMTIEQMWRVSHELRFTRDRTVEDLWGFCRKCYYADVCRAGCTWTSHSLLGRAGNNPYCHYRVLKLAGAGLRERIEKVETAPGRPFDHARFDLVLEPLDGGPGDRVVQIPPLPQAPSKKRRATEDRVPTTLPICRGCDQYVLPQERMCPHCGADIAEANTHYEAAIVDVRTAAAEIEGLLAQLPQFDQPRGDDRRHRRS